MATIITRQTGATAVNRTLTNAELDSNFINLNTDVASRILLSEKGAADGVATLDGSGKVPSTQLPSYVDDVLEYASLAAFPESGETSKIYVALDTNKAYRWSGSTYVYITSGAVDSVAGKTGVVILNSSDVGLGNVNNTADSVKNVLSATKWTTPRTVTIGNTGKAVDGTEAVSWTLAEIGAQAAGTYLTPKTIYALESSVNDTWYTIAQNTTTTEADVSGKFVIYDQSGLPNHVTFIADTDSGYGYLSVVSNSGFGSISKIRLVIAGATALVQILINGSVGQPKFTFENQTGTNTWTPVDWAADTTSYSASQIKAEINIGSNAGALIHTGRIMAGGLKTQYDVLHLGNYNYYAPTLTGGGASGTWGINITGSSASAGSATTVARGSGNIATVLSPGSGTYNQHVVYATASEFGIEAALATDSGSGTKLPLVFTWRGGYDAQGGFKITGASSAELGGNVVLHAGNYGSYAMPKTGIADNTDQYVNFRVIRNSNSSSSNDGMYIGYANSNSGVTRIYGGGATSGGIAIYGSGISDVQIAGNIVLNAGNYGSYALPLSGGTVTGLTTFSASESLNLKGIRGAFSAGSDTQGIHLFSNVDIGYPSGWGGGLGYTPARGLSTYGAIRANYGYETASCIYIGAGSVTTSNALRINWHNDSDLNYYIGKRGGAWTQSMDIAFYTGIRHHANYSYGGHRWYTNGVDDTLSFSVGDGDHNVRVANTLFIGGNTALHAGNYASYALPRSGGTLVSGTDQILTLNKTSGTAWNYIGFSYGDARQFYFGMNSSYEPELGTNNGSTFRVLGGMTVGGNAVITAGNYTSYALGSFGNTFTIADWNTLTQYGSRRTAPDGADANGPPINQYGNLLVFGGGGDGVTQMQAGHDGHLAWRTKWNASDWTNWNIALHTGNYNSYALPLSGGTLTGTIGSNLGDGGRLFASYNASAGSPLQFYIDHSYGNVVIGNARGEITLASSLRTSSTLLIAGTYDANAYNSYTGARLLFGGGNSDAQNSYYIGTNLENYNGNYNKLDLRWHTGIRIGAQAQYGGVRFYDSEALGTVIFSVGRDDANVRVTNTLYIGGNTALHAGNYSSYALPLSGGTATGSIATTARIIVGSGQNSSWLDMVDTDEGTRYLHNNSGTIGFVGSHGGWLFRVADDGNIEFRNRGWLDSIFMRKDTNQTMFAGQTSALSFENQTSFFRFAFNELRFYDWNSGGDILTLNGDVSTPNYFVGKWDSSGRNYSREWIEFPNHTGLYSELNSAHFYPNNATYGSWRIAGSRNGWAGLSFDASNGIVALMINPDSNTVGFHNQNYGWQMRWNNGVGYVHKGAYGGGTEATILDSANYTNYVPQTYSGWPGYPGINANDFYGSSWHRSSFTYANNAPLTGAIATFPAGGYDMQLNGGYNNHSFSIRSRNGDQGYWMDWKRIVTDYNYNDYAPTLTGGGASGTWNISVSGNLTGTRPNLGYCEYNQNVAYEGQGGPQIIGNGSSASMISFHRPGYYGINFGLDTDNNLRVGGWSLGNVSRIILNSLNFADYAVSLSANSTLNSDVRNTRGVTRLYRRDDNSDYSVQTYWTGSYWRLYGYAGDSGHADTQVGLAGRADRANGNFYIDDNYGNGVVGVYSSYRYQGVFAMGDSYKLPADGTSTGSLYGMAWSHPNAGGAAGNLTDHGLLIINNGAFKCAISNSIVASGNVTAYSDERLKTNWQNMPENFVARLAKVKVGIYDRIDEDNVTQVGVSAQSLQQLLPQAIITANDDMKTLSVSYGNAALASAVELAKDNVELRNRIERLERIIDKLLGE